MRIPRLLTACALLSACAGHYKTELVGQGTAFMQPRGTLITPSPTDAGAPGAMPPGAIPLPRGSYDLALWFDLPRAQVVDWTVTCPGVHVNGSVGEAFEQYRARRLAELRAQRRRDQQQVASVTSAIVGAVTPTVRGTGYVETPAGSVVASGSARVPAGAVGEAVATAAIDDVVELPPGDLGRGQLQSMIHVETGGDGLCAVTAAAEDPNVLGRFQITRVRDLDAEARLRVMASTSQAMQIRGKLKGQLVVVGADPERRTRQIAAAHAEAELHAEAEIELRAHAEAEIELRAHAEAEVEVRYRGIAYNARHQLLAWLVTECHADPDRLTRLHAQVTAEREARVRSDRLLADREQLRLDMVVRARGQLQRYLVSIGAVERPPMPELVAENPGVVPFAGAHWTSGRWSWGGGRWQWIAGGWSDPDVFTETGGGGVVEANDTGGPDLSLGVGVGYEGSSGSSRGEPNRDHRTSAPAVDTSPRDHRTPEHHDPVVVHDHRGEATAGTVRDHRSDSSSSSSKKDDDKVRDHRR